MKHLFVAGLFAAPLLFAQSSTFEVASVKINRDPNPRGSSFRMLPSGRVSIVKVPVYTVIARAYDLPAPSMAERLVGGPDWVRSETYDIEATAGAFPPNTTPADRAAAMKRMLQALLAERFQLRLSHSVKDLPVYELTVAKGGTKLKPAQVTEGECTTGTPIPPCHELSGGIGRGLHGKAVTISDITHYAENWADRPILDRSGLTGLYEIDTEGWVPMQARAPAPDGTPLSAEAIALADPARPTLFLVMDRIGLKMEPGKSPLDVYVIEHVERPLAN